MAASPLVVRQSLTIDAPPETVRKQFADVAHHEATGVHRDAAFTVINDDGTVCRYAQVSKLGPLAMRQEFELERVKSGPLINRIVSGPFTGGSITFAVRPAGDGGSTVDATLEAAIPAPLRIIAPVLRSRISRQLAFALAEDKVDIEQGGYAPDGDGSD